MFTDAVGNARKEYERLTAAGQKATPVWKQVLSSLFLVADFNGYRHHADCRIRQGNREFLLSLFSEKSVAGLAEAQEELNKAMQESDTGIGKNIVLLRTLQEKWASLGNDLSAKKKFITDNKEEFDRLNVAVANVADAENLLVGNTEAFHQIHAAPRQRCGSPEDGCREIRRESLRLQLEIEKGEETSGRHA